MLLRGFYIKGCLLVLPKVQVKSTDSQIHDEVHEMFPLRFSLLNLEHLLRVRQEKGLENSAAKLLYGRGLFTTNIC